MLLYQAGLIYAENATTYNDFQWIPYYLTWGGHEFLDTIRDEKTWKNLLVTASKETGGLAFDVIKSMALSWAKQKAAQVGLPIGLD